MQLMLVREVVNIIEYDSPSDSFTILIKWLRMPFLRSRTISSQSQRPVHEAAHSF